MYFVFKPENFVKTDGFFVYSEKQFPFTNIGVCDGVE